MLLRMSEMWRSNIEQAGEFEKLWFKSMMPVFTMRAAGGSLLAAAQGDEISKTIKRMAEAPRLADMCNLDRQVYALMAAWMDVSQRMATYQAIATVPWSKAYERYRATLADTKGGDAKDFGWRKAFGKWRDIANEELISNLRSKDFLAAQREWLLAALELRTRQQQMTDSVGKLFGVSNQRDFDALTRQITELRRELRASLRAQRDAAVRAGGVTTQPGEE
nr:poly(R)-hydroxyalkanoic acid synthase subunit PhaE [Rhizobium sp. PEPV16]